jgi:hypothetical protein
VKSLVWAAAVTGATVVAVVAGTMVPAQPVPDVTARDSGTRVSVICPSFATQTADISVAAVGIDQSVRTSNLSTPAAVTESPGLAVVKNPGQPVRVSANNANLFGATTVSAAANGNARGLGATQCLAAQTTHWFTGVDISQQAQSEFTLVNMDSTEAVVDITGFGADGGIEVRRSLSVAGGSSMEVSLSEVARSATPIAVEVTSSPGRVAAFLRQSIWSKKTLLGADWVPESATPSTDLVVAGVPGSAGRRTLVVANPSDRTAAVKVQMLTSNGSLDIADAQRIEVPPSSSRSVELAAGLGGQAAAVRLTSNQAVTASVLVDNGLAPAANDTAVAGATSALGADAVWPMAFGKTTAATLQLANSGTEDATVQLSVTPGGAAAQTSEVKVTAGSSAQVALPKAAALTIRIQTASSSVHGSVIANEMIGKVHGLAILDLSSQASTSRSTGIVFDPHLG